MHVFLILLVLNLCKVHAEDTIEIRKCAEDCLWVDYSYFNLTLSNDSVSLNVPQQASFFIVQVHSQLHPLAITKEGQPGSKLIARNNVGLVQIISNDTDNFRFSLLTKSDNIESTVLVAITSYNATDPIPGGCNMEFYDKVAPYQIVNYNDDIIIDRFQSPSSVGEPCEMQDNDTNLQVYSMQLKHLDFSEETYYETIIRMLTVGNIIKHGSLATCTKSELERFFVNYQGFGTVFSVIALSKTGTSAYIPAFTYGCDISDGYLHCLSPKVVTYLMSLTAVMVIFTISLLVENLFSISFAPSTFVFIIGLTVLPYGHIYALVWPVVMTILALIVAILDVKFRFGKAPLVKGLFVGFLLGYLFTAVLLFAFEEYFGQMQNSIEYFVTYYSIVTILTASTIVWYRFGQLLCACISFIITIGCFTSYGGLLYVILNHIRRIWVTDFDYTNEISNRNQIFAFLCIFSSVVVFIYFLRRSSRNGYTAI